MFIWRSNVAAKNSVKPTCVLKRAKLGGKKIKKSASVLSNKGSPAVEKDITHCQPENVLFFFHSVTTANVTDSCLCLAEWTQLAPAGNLRDPNFLRLLANIFTKIHSAAQNMQHIHKEYSLRIYVCISSVLKVGTQKWKQNAASFKRAQLEIFFIQSSLLMKDLGGRSFHSQSWHFHLFLVDLCLPVECFNFVALVASTYDYAYIWNMGVYQKD